MVGRTLGHYEILEPLGAGGMGEVYRARDTKLDRDVAIKVLPDDFATDQDRLARFEREAKLLASLNHTNIAAIYGLEDEGNQRFIVMEVVEGKTLAERLARSGRIEVDETLQIARQIAEALEAAHENGVIHRDLKPANIKVTPEGKVKVLDFGLAKAYEAEDASAEVSPDLSNSPTIAAATNTGIILGTAAYMSPEQAKGRPLDKRTDIWSFGALVFEMLTGHPSFRGEAVSETLAAILKDEPDWTELPATLPLTARALLRRCLRKDRDKRLHDIADARIELEEATDEFRDQAGVVAPPTPTTSPRWQRVTPWAIAALMTIVAAVATTSGVRGPERPADQQALRIPIVLPTETSLEGVQLPVLAISPDGSTIAYSADREISTRERKLRIRFLDQVEELEVVDTRLSHTPFFSPDGAWIAYVDVRAGRRQLWKIGAKGGSPLPIADLPSEVRGATWGKGDTIVFAVAGDGLFTVSATGREDPEPLTHLDTENGERAHAWPQFLPDGETLFFNVIRQEGGPDGKTLRADEADIAVMRLGDPAVHVIESGAFPRYDPVSRHLLFVREPVLFAAPFDVRTSQVTGPPVPVESSVWCDGGGTGATSFDVSRSGVLVFEPNVREIPEDLELVFVDKSGNVEPLGVELGPFIEPRFSWNGKRIAFSKVETRSRHIWILDLERMAFDRFTADGYNFTPAWSPDDTFIAFSSSRAGGRHVLMKRTDMQSEAVLLWEGGIAYPDSWSPDGETLLLSEYNPTTIWDISAIDIDGDRIPRPVVNVGRATLGGIFSPGGQWIAYTSDETGRWEIWITPYPELSWNRQVSLDGGHSPTWDPNSGELYFRSGDEQVWSVTVDGDASDVRIGAPEILFERQLYASDDWWTWDISPDGERFVMSRRTSEPQIRDRIVIAFNWQGQLGIAEGR